MQIGPNTTELVIDPPGGDNDHNQHRAADEIHPFRSDIPQADLDDINDRLARTRRTDEVAGWDYGTNLGYLKELVECWRREFPELSAFGAIEMFAGVRQTTRILACGRNWRTLEPMICTA